MRAPTRMVLDAIAAVVTTDTGLRVGDLPTVVACWIADDDGDDLGPDDVCRLTDGRYVVRVDGDRIRLGGLVRRLRRARDACRLQVTP